MVGPGGRGPCVGAGAGAAAGACATATCEASAAIEQDVINTKATDRTRRAKGWPVKVIDSPLIIAPLLAGLECDQKRFRRTRSLKVASNIRHSTKAKPSLKPTSCARSPSGLPKTASHA